MPIPWDCTKVGDVNRDGDIDSDCTVTLSEMIGIEGGMRDSIYDKFEFQLSSEITGTHEAEENTSCRYEKTPVDTYYHYKSYKPFCTEDRGRCFRVTDSVLDRSGFSKKIEAFEISTHFDIALKKYTSGFNVVFAGCELADISGLKPAPQMAEEHPFIWNAFMGIILLTNNPAQLFGLNPK